MEEVAVERRNLGNKVEERSEGEADRIKEE